MVDATGAVDGGVVIAAIHLLTVEEIAMHIKEKDKVVDCTL
jgi:hypothetical protein